QVELKEKPRSGLKLAAAAREAVIRCRRGKAGNVSFAGNRSPLRPTQFVSRHIISTARILQKKNGRLKAVRSRCRSGDYSPESSWA
ncbi:MAG: hypothetical protein II621_04045, partial [Clostridia bacterium]|nr:hypothetical protein [Clostridia bacterium]